jgi:flagellar basal body-associated protein FliL
MNPQIIVVIFIVAAAAAGGVYYFVKSPKEKRIANIKEWLKYAVVEAEKALGSGTGQLKLRMVYDMAIKQFPWVVNLVPFETFSSWVDESLGWMNKQLETNKAAQEYVETK